MSCVGKSEMVLDGGTGEGYRDCDAEALRSDAGETASGSTSTSAAASVSDVAAEHCVETVANGASSSDEKVVAARAASLQKASSSCSTRDSLSESRHSPDPIQRDDSYMSHSLERDATPSPRQSSEMQSSGHIPMAPYMLAEPNWYIVSYLGGIEVRMEPHFDAVRTGTIIMQNEVIPVCEEVDNGDGRIYLRLFDGSGWIFDDSQLMPQDPSVVRAGWMPSPMTPVAPPAPTDLCVLSTNAPRVPVSQFRVAYLGGIRVRTAPSIESPCTGTMLMQGDVFSVAEELQGADGRLYLSLCNQPGWAFDDSGLMPHDPSAVREPWERPGVSENIELRMSDSTDSNQRLLATRPTVSETPGTWEWDASWTRRAGGRRNKRGSVNGSRQQQSRRS